MKKWSWVLLLISHSAMAQIKWTGNHGTAYWSDPLNWEGDRLPGADDRVILDNQYFSNSYEIILPDTAVQIQSLEISPSNNAVIRLLLPVSNTVTSSSASLEPRAFTCHGAGYSILLRNNAVFINASGSASGYSMRINDSIRIENGAKYIHRSRTGHADYLAQLSRAPGTETGVFRMENTDAASTFSISGRVFGSLELSAEGSSTKTTTYSSSGTNPTLIRGNLLVDSGVLFALHMSDTMHIAGDVLLRGAGLNLSSGNRSSCLNLKGNLVLEQAQVFESNTTGATGTLLFKSETRQELLSAGVILDSIRLVLDNRNGLGISTQLNLPYELRLENGFIELSDQPLVIQSGGWISIDSLNQEAGIVGKIRKEGLAGERVFFPFASAAGTNLLQVESFTGTVEAAYSRADANLPGQVFADGVAEVSSLEYWSLYLQPEEQSAPAKFQFSYAAGRSGQFFDLQNLIIASYYDGSWNNIVAGLLANSSEEGGVVEAIINPEQLNGNYRFAFANSIAGANVLPVLLERAWLTKSYNSWQLNWSVADAGQVEEFEIEHSVNGLLFTAVSILKHVTGQRNYSVKLPPSVNAGFCRLKINEAYQLPKYSKLFRLSNSYTDTEPVTFFSTQSRTFTIQSAKPSRFHLAVYSSAGSLLYHRTVEQQQGSVSYPLPALFSGKQWVIIRVSNESGWQKTSSYFY